jgi:hypothetical protein
LKQLSETVSIALRTIEGKSYRAKGRTGDFDGFDLPLFIFFQSDRLLAL